MKFLVACFAIFAIVVSLPQVAVANSEGPEWAIAPDEDTVTSPYLWPIDNYRVLDKGRVGLPTIYFKKARFYAKAPKQSWDPHWRIGNRAYFYEKANGHLNLIGHGTIVKTRVRRYDVRIEASIESFLYHRPVVLRAYDDRGPHKIIRQNLIGGRLPRNQRWFMSFSLQ